MEEDTVGMGEDMAEAMVEDMADMGVVMEVMGEVLL